MTTIKRGTIKDYDAGAHRAAVQVAGSLATYLPAVPVAADIPAAAVVAGRDCGIVFFSDDDPEDAVVSTVHGASPPSSFAASVFDTDGDTGWETELTSDEDRLRAYVAGTLRTLVQGGSPHHQLTGDVKVSGRFLGEGTPAPAQAMLEVGGGGTYSGRIGLQASLGGRLSEAAGNVAGIGGFAIARTSGDSIAHGLNFAAGMSSIDLQDARAINTFGFVFGSGRTLTNYVHHYRAAIGPVLATITNVYGDYHAAQNAGTNRRYIYAEDIPGGTIARFVEFASAFIVKGSGEYTKAANQTPVFIYEGTTPTLRQVQWKDGAAIAGGDRVMVLV